MRMPSFATLLMALLVAQYAYAKTDQPCISKATEALPHIAGLVVKKNADASRFGCDFGHMEGPDPAHHCGRGFRRRGRDGDLLLPVRDNAGRGLRAAHDELMQIQVLSSQ